MSTRKRRKSSAGFTLAETLLAVLILLMVSSIVAAGVPAAKNAYEKVVLASNAEILLSTTMSSALRNELGLASKVEVKKISKNEEETAIIYYNNTIGATSQICLNGDLDTDARKPQEPDDVIMYQRYAKTDMSAGSDATRLISKEASTNGLYVTYDFVEYENGILTIYGLRTNHGTAKLDHFSIRIISYSGDTE